MTKPHKLKPLLPRGFADQNAADIDALNSMAQKIETVFRSYGFARIETPLFEYTEALGKFMPDTDRPNEGVFSLQDEDEQWLSLRYDLTAPLARYVAQHFDALPKPFRSYRFGPVFRNEKSGPGRFRQFLQFDADTVGSATPASDAEMCMMMADTLEVLGLKRGDYLIKVNDRKILDGVMDALGLSGEQNAGKRLSVMRAIDKLDRLGESGVHALLGTGRKDESGDFTKGAGLADKDISRVVQLLKARADTNEATIDKLSGLMAGEALSNLREIATLCRENGYREDRIVVDPSIVRGLDYYTGTVFEAEPAFSVTNDKGEKVIMGSLAGGGRYDGLIARFRGEAVPATGFSIGVSRLLAALKSRGLADAATTPGPVVVCTALGAEMAGCLRFAKLLREAGIAAEVYFGTSSKLGNQLTYASKRGSVCAVMQGDDERGKGEVVVKDLILGEQVVGPEKDLAKLVRDIYQRHKIS